MHELALADAIVMIALENARGKRVARVELEVGALRQVVPDALTFAFDLCADGTPAAGAELAIEEIPARVDCRSCGEETQVDSFPFVCGACGSFDVEVKDGQQFQVVALELEEVEFVGSK